mgnify:CR=1 FL=1
MRRPGGYYVAVAADKIYVNKASVVGSIGVILDGFWPAVGTMEKIGAERRVLTARARTRRFADPFFAGCLRSTGSMRRRCSTKSTSSSSMWSKLDAA